MPDVLMLDRIGGAYTAASLLAGGLGGSEIELLQVARGLTAKGHSVVVANGVDHVSVEDGITYIPSAQAWQHAPSKALYLQRFSSPETLMQIPSSVRVVVRANDVYCPPYDVHRSLLESGRATLVTNTNWQAGLFQYAKDTRVIPPMLEPMPKVKKARGLFVFASGAMKGFEATVALWCAMKQRHSAMCDSQLAIANPGWGKHRPLTNEEKSAGVWDLEGLQTPKRYRRTIAKAEGLFTVLTMPETFCCAAALAERAGTKRHILCTAGLGGLPDAVMDQFGITEDPNEFEDVFLAALGKSVDSSDLYTLPDLTPAHLIDEWAETLHLDASKALPVSVESTFAADPTLAKNQEHLGPFFGDFLSLLRGAIAPGGSEFGVGLTLFSLAASIQAKYIVEIGRFKGFSTLSLAAACKLQEVGWAEPAAARQRPDVNYASLSQPASVVSIDAHPTLDCKALLRRADLDSFVTCLDQRSSDVNIVVPIDLLFIDGGHAKADVRSDVQRFVPLVRPGGYFILHDYFGWFTADGKNGSPIAQVIAEELTGCDRVLIDTHYASLVIFRKAKNLTESWDLPPQLPKVAPRADSRPTVGLVIIAKGDEASTVVTRAIVSGKKAGVDCVTVVCDASDASAEVAQSLGAEVVKRSTPAHDWDRGIGWIAAARNEALSLAEPRTDYVLCVDADDYFDGVLPATLDKDAYEITIQDGGLTYQRIQLFRSVLGCRYHGIIHETLQMGAVGPLGRLTTLRYHRGHSSYGAQGLDPIVKFSKHAHLAQKWLLDHPDDTRMQFYLARSFHDAGRLDEAVTSYDKRIGMLGGWEEERGYSAYQMGLILIQQGKDPTSILLKAHELSLHRAEPLVALARWYRDDARRQFSSAYAFARRAEDIPMPADGLFLIPWVYQFEAAAEVAIAAYWLGRKPEALERFEALLPRVPAERKQWCQEQIAICRRDLGR